MLFNFVNGNNNTYHILIQINLVEYFGCLVNIKIINKACYVRFISVCLDKLKGLFSPFAAGSESGINAVLLLKATSFVTAVEIKHGNFAACASINETGSPS